LVVGPKFTTKVHFGFGQPYFITQQQSTSVPNYRSIVILLIGA
jgi:hypothetical protein